MQGHYKPIVFQKNFKKPWKITYATDAATNSISDGGFPEIQLVFWNKPDKLSPFYFNATTGFPIDDKMGVRYDYQVVFSE